MRAALAKAAPDPALSDFYAARDDRPLWIDGRQLRPEAQVLLAAIRDAKTDDLRPEAYDLPALTGAVESARSGRPAALARAEVALSRALAAYASDLHRPRPGAELVYTDAAVRPQLTSEREVLDAVASAPTLAQGIAAARRTNPIYSALRTLLAAEIARGGPNAALLRINLERARALPADLGRRYILVDVTAQRLWAYEDGRPRDSMRVVVGKPSEPTPQLAGMIRYTVFRPYWNVPTDLVRDNIAPRVLREGMSYFRERRFEALSDWGDDPRVLDPAKIDWKAVAAGREELRLRQRPGRDNMMGQMKFMFPNDLGVYLHDTPLKALFVDGPRTASSGCVRLEDAARIGRWLLGPQTVEAGRRPGPPEERVDLAEPTPVYLVYFTAAPAGAGVSLRPDVYGRDAALLAAITPPRRRSASRAAEPLS